MRLPIMARRRRSTTASSGGAGSVQHFIDLFKEIPDIDAGLAASVFHFGEIEIKDLKKELKANDITVRL